MTMLIVILVGICFVLLMLDVIMITVTLVQVH